MTSDRESLLEIVGPQAGGGNGNRRTRLDPSIEPQLLGWLHRAARVHASLCGTIRRFADPSKAGGEGLCGDDYKQRLERGDRTLLADAVGLAIDDLTDIRTEIISRMDAAEPTDAEPGSPEKVAVMVRRAYLGESLFVSRDRQVDVA